MENSIKALNYNQSSNYGRYRIFDHQSACPSYQSKKEVGRSITAHHYALFPATLGNLCSCGERNGAQRRTKVFHDASIGTVVIGENAHCSKLIFLSKHLQHI